ncbi:MAG TPA: hypothetical protein VI542_26820 [Candidatus Tectomicrobia bacterium]
MLEAVPRRLHLYVVRFVLAAVLVVVPALCAFESVNFPNAPRQAGSAVQLSVPTMPVALCSLSGSVLMSR